LQLADVGVAGVEDAQRREIGLRFEIIDAHPLHRGAQCCGREIAAAGCDRAQAERRAEQRHGRAGVLRQQVGGGEPGAAI
jgi:hypothetical protein